ncbi:hypothetical protein EVAR_81879_1 [Eumeta japonica]|uniref:Uncharacterized protein n=1 Tax=Eumeta variegata TaxID=151549 RepID=A0A4C1UWW8_EUMVA|nr:hypothetical protein EVAR_81879_1 [Eumeta japonica]
MKSSDSDPRRRSGHGLKPCMARANAFSSGRHQRQDTSNKASCRLAAHAADHRYYELHVELFGAARPVMSSFSRSSVDPFLDVSTG